MQEERERRTRHTESLGDELASLWAHVSAVMCQWLGLLAEFDDLEGWHDDGFGSCAEWVSWRCSIAPVTAREYVRVARRLRELPAVRAAFAAGELSYSKVRAISRIGDGVDDAVVLGFAREATAAQLVRIVAACRGASREDAERAYEQRFLDVVADDDGTYVVRGRLTAEDGALLVRALEAVIEPPEREAPTPVAARRADALVRLAAPDGPGTPACEVVVHLDADALAPEPATERDRERVRSEIEAGPAIARATARRLCCDAALVGVVERDGAPLSVGRRTRAIPPAIRRALRARQATCAFPGCERHRWLDAHHVRHWADGGETSLDNLLHLCRHHHRLVHEGGWSIRPLADGGPGFVRPDGRLHRARRPTACPSATHGLPPDEARPSPGSLMPRATDLRFDLGLTVDALLGTRKRESAAP